jgi:hypothetical protein
MTKTDLELNLTKRRSTIAWKAAMRGAGATD